MTEPNHFPHGDPPGYFATTKRSTHERHKCGGCVTSDHNDTNCGYRSAFAGNSIGLFLHDFKNARNILKTNARPALPDHAPAGGAGLPSETLKNFAASTFSYFVLGFPFALVLVAVSIWELLFE